MYSFHHQLEGPIDLPEVPSVRLTKPASRTADEDEEIKKAVVAALVDAGQFSGSRPAVINSVGTLVARVRLLIRLHEQETLDGHTVFFHDLVQYGGIAQAWSAKKAGRSP